MDQEVWTRTTEREPNDTTLLNAAADQPWAKWLTDFRYRLFPH